MIDVDTGRKARAPLDHTHIGILLFVALSAAYAVCVGALAARKLMWNDELYTYYIARLPSMHDVLGALMARGEQTPPLFYVITRLFLGLIGVNNVSIRLPEMCAFWLMCACLYAIVARRMSSWAALGAAAFPLVTSAFPYAYEARAYGLVLGFSAAGFLCWQIATSATTTRGRVGALVALTVSLAAAVSSHYYGAFVLLPFACGEAVRTATRRRVAVGVWVALALSVAPLALHLPLIKAATAYSGAFWSPPQWINLPDFYEGLLEPGLLAIVGIAILSSIQAARDGVPPPDDADAPSLPPHEWAAVTGFILIPLACLIAAKLITGAFVNRYALPSVIGFAVIAGVAIEQAFRRAPGLRALAVGCLAGWFVLSQAREYVAPTGVSLPVSAASIARAVEWTAAAAPAANLPLVIADPHTFTVLSHYGPAAIQSRLVYLADPDRALARLGHNSVERGMLDLVAPWFHMNVVPFEPFVATHARFLIYGDFLRLAFLNWLQPELRARGVHLELLNRADSNMLLLARRDAG